MQTAMHLLAALRSRLARHDPRWRGAVFGGVLCAALGAWLGGWWWQAEIDTLQQLREQVAALQAGTPAAAGSAAVKAPSAASMGKALGLVGPAPAQQARLWPLLQQHLRAHGLQVLSLQPGPLVWQDGLPEQSLVLELQGRWRDWRTFEQAFDAHAPWWTVTQWQVTPAGVADQVRMQWHWRWAWQAHAQTGERDSPSANEGLDWPRARPGTPAMPDAAPLFAINAVAGEATPAPQPEAALGPMPSDWPVQSLRLLGVWQQAGVFHAVLGQGLQQVVVTAGQRVGREGYRVLHVEPGAVVLRPHQRSGPELRLLLKGEVR